MIAIDIGGTKIAVAHVIDGKASDVVSVPTPAQEGAEAILDAAAEAARSCGHAPGEPVAVSSAGVIDPFAGIVTFATSQLSGWQGTDVARGLGERLACEVSVLNDVQAHALGEYRYGAGRGSRSMLLIAPGTGIGGGLILEGRLILGAHFAAGHVGHIDAHGAEGKDCTCGRDGHVEAIASGYGIEHAYGTGESGKDIAHRAEGGEEKAVDVVTRAGHALGRLAGGLVNVFDPELVVTAGSVTKSGEVWQRAFDEGFAQCAMDVVRTTPVVRGELDNAALVGAAVWLEEKESYAHK